MRPTVELSPDILRDWDALEQREWLATDGLGGYASGTLAGTLTRSYHGLLVTAQRPPVQRTMTITKVDETVEVGETTAHLYRNRWADGTVEPGPPPLAGFRMEGTAATWTFRAGDAEIEKRVFMEHGRPTTYLLYRVRGSQPVRITARVLATIRDHHVPRPEIGSGLQVTPMPIGVTVGVEDGPVVNVVADRGRCGPNYAWVRNLMLAVERDRGLPHLDTQLHAATFTVDLQPEDTWTVVCTTDPDPDRDGRAALERHRKREDALLQTAALPLLTPQWLEPLVIAADQFLVTRRTEEGNEGSSVVAGYPWFTDWGRDAMIALPGLAISTGRPHLAGEVLRTYARFVDRGQIPNHFPDEGKDPEYNTVDGALWFINAVAETWRATRDEELLAELFPTVESIIDNYQRGTRFGIGVDSADGLVRAGEPGSQLTWMDAKVDEWVVTPRHGKAVEVNALWYRALRSAERLAMALAGDPHRYLVEGDRVRESFQRFWNPEAECLYDVVDGEHGDDPSIRPNQIFAVSLESDLLEPRQQRAVVDRVTDLLLTSVGLRSLAPSDDQYHGIYAGDRLERDAAYHQGSAWTWLLGPFAIGHFRAYQDRTTALGFLRDLEPHLSDAGLGSISEIFDGDPPHTPRGCPWQAWSVAEILRAWRFLTER